MNKKFTTNRTSYSSQQENVPSNESITRDINSRHLSAHSLFYGLVIIMIPVLLILFILFHWIVGFAQVSGVSMNDTLYNGQTVIFNRLTTNFHRGDIVSIHMVNGETYVKRIIAFPGETVELVDGNVFVDGKQLDESTYSIGTTNPETSTITFPYTVEKDRYFVMGDNREHSIDSRYFGSISSDQIEGIVILH